MNDKGSKNHTVVKIPNEQMFEIHYWNHISVVFNRSMMRNCTVSVYINGMLIANSKVSYLKLYLLEYGFQNISELLVRQK